MLPPRRHPAQRLPGAARGRRTASAVVARVELLVEPLQIGEVGGEQPLDHAGAARRRSEPSRVMTRASTMTAR